MGKVWLKFAFLRVCFKSSCRRPKGRAISGSGSLDLRPKGVQTELLKHFLSSALAVVIMGCGSTPPTPPAAAVTSTPSPLTATLASAEPASTAKLKFVSLDVHQAFFNPDKDKPVFLNMMSSFEFVNQHNDNLEVKYPEFKLTINGIPWTDLVSTDFQIGRLPPQATQSIELQSILYMNKMTSEQKDVLELIKAGKPVDLKLIGTIEVYPNGQKKILDVEFAVDHVVLSESWN